MYSDVAIKEMISNALGCLGYPEIWARQEIAVKNF